MYRNKSIFVAGLLCLISLQGWAKEATKAATIINGRPVALARYAKAYIGEGNVTVEVAPFKYDSSYKEGAILLFKGIEGPWDGQAIVHEVVSSSTEGQSYRAEYDGKSWETMRIKPSLKTIALYVPGVNGDIKLAPSDGAAQLTTPRAIYETYLEQLKPGGASK